MHVQFFIIFSLVVFKITCIYADVITNKSSFAESSCEPSVTLQVLYDLLIAGQKRNEENRAADQKRSDEHRAADQKQNEENRAADQKRSDEHRAADRKFLFDLIKGRHHDLGSEIASNLEDASVHFRDNTNKAYSTGHYIFYDDKYLLLSVSHGPHAPDAYICHENIDVQISGGCPLKSAINISRHVPLRMGDEASTFGYIYENEKFIPRFWKGVLGGKLGNDKKHLSSKTIFLGDEYVFQGVSQLNGMSGGPTVNGAGYTGMVHGSVDYLSDSRITLACVIPFNLIQSLCIKRMKIDHPSTYRSLKSYSDCVNVKIVDIPQF